MSMQAASMAGTEESLTAATAGVVRPLIRRPAPLPADGGVESEEGSLGEVVPMPQRTPPPEALEANTTEAEPVVLDTGTSERALVTEMTRIIAVAALEVMGGSRPVQQLARWLDTRCFNALTTRARLYAQACLAQGRHAGTGPAAGTVTELRHQAIVHSIHCFPVSPGIYETSVVIADTARFRALALRLEESHGTWKVTALRIG